MNNKNVREFCQKKNRTCLLKAFVSTFVLLIPLILLFPYLTLKLGMINAILLSLITLSLPALFFRVFTLLFDRDWSGKITDVKVITKTGSYNYYGKTHICEKNTVVLTVLKEDGKTVVVNAKSFVSPGAGENVQIGREYHYRGLVPISDPREILERYKVGDTVYHVAGFKEPVVASGSLRRINCFSCGLENSVNEDVCASCKAPLLK